MNLMASAPAALLVALLPLACSESGAVQADAGSCGNSDITGQLPACTTALEGVQCLTEAAPCQPLSQTCTAGQWVTDSINMGNSDFSCTDAGARVSPNSPDAGSDAPAGG